MPINRYTIIKNNCFDEKFKATKSIINPPYGQRSNNELDFIIKQLDSVADKGLCVVILPVSKLNKKTAQRSTILKQSRILKIILCNNNLFYPTASVKCCILLLMKDSNGHSGSTDIIDYRNDGFVVKRGSGLVRTSNISFDDCPIQSTIISDKTDDWTYLNTQFENRINRHMLQRALISVSYVNELYKLENSELIENNDNAGIIYHEFAITSLFKILKKPIVKYRPANNEMVAMIAAKNNKNGMKCMTAADENTFNGNKIVLVTGGNGGAGLAFYQEYPFKIVSTTCTLEPIKIKLDKYIGIYCACELSKYKAIYSRGFDWTNERIKKDTITLPVKNDNNIDYNAIKQLMRS